MLLRRLYIFIKFANGTTVCLLVVADENTLKVQRVPRQLVWLENGKLLQTLGTTAEIIKY